MPELPEVEAARRNLDHWLRRKKLVTVEIPKTRVIRPAAPETLEQALDGRVVRAVERRGKWLRFVLDDGAHLYGHLGMSGRWVKTKKNAPEMSHQRARLDTGNTSIRYLDPRLFGRLVLRRPGETWEAWEELGPDPLADGLDPSALETTLSKRKKSIKETLLDQTVFAGVGNIHATEALWRAKLGPRRRAQSLRPAEIRALVKGLEASLREGVARYGTEITYVEDPGAENPFAVYGKSGEPCPRCRSVLRRIVQGGRSTVYCPRCQPARG